MDLFFTFVITLGVKLRHTVSIRNRLMFLLETSTLAAQGIGDGYAIVEGCACTITEGYFYFRYLGFGHP